MNPGHDTENLFQRFVWIKPDLVVFKRYVAKNTTSGIDHR